MLYHDQRSEIIWQISRRASHIAQICTIHFLFAAKLDTFKSQTLWQHDVCFNQPSRKPKETKAPYQLGATIAKTLCTFSYISVEQKDAWNRGLYWCFFSTQKLSKWADGRILVAYLSSVDVPFGTSLVK